jgi:hypothetical protein
MSDSIGPDGIFGDTDGDGQYEQTEGDGISPPSVSNNSFNGREEWSTGAVTITVGTDTATLQEAVDLIPHVPYHAVEVDIPSGFDASAEDVVIPQTQLGKGEIDARGFEHKVKIVGDTATPANCPVGSIVVAGATGGVISIDGVELQHDNPYDDESTPVGVYYSDQVRLKDCAFAGGTNGPKAYGGAANLSLYNVDFGANALSGNALDVKHGGRIRATAGNTPVSGNVGGYVLTARSGVIEIDSAASTLTGDSGLIDPTNSRNGFITDKSQDSEVVTNYRGNNQFESLKQDETLGVVTATAAQTIADATMTTVGFDTAVETETATFDDAADQLTVRRAGRFKITGMVQWASATGWSTGDRASLRIVKNEGQTSEELLSDPVQRKVGTGQQAVSVAASRQLAAGDTISLQAYQDSGASKDLSGSDTNNYLEIVRVG